MAPIAAWSLLVGCVFLLAALGKGPLRKWPLSMPAVYLLIGMAIGPWGSQLLTLDLVTDAKLVEVLTEIAVLVSLLTAGLQLAPSWTLMRRSPVPLATIAMTLTIGGIAMLTHFTIGLSWGAAVLLGAVLAPTDPVLASEVQVQHRDDKDRLRYALTGEAGLNDGAAFPFIMLGLGLLGVHGIGDFAWRWVAVDLIWATTAGIASGWVCGYFVSRLVVWLKRQTEHPVSSEELLTLGLIGLSYGIALSIHAYGFLSVFAAGVAVRRFADADADEDKRSDGHAEALLSKVATINERFGEVLEASVTVLIGCLLTTSWTLPQDWWISIALFALIRPVAVYVSLCRSNIGPIQTRLIAFFGIRGIGSLYYLSYAIGKGVDEATAERLSGIVLTTVALSLLIHSNIASKALAYYADRE